MLELRICCDDIDYSSLAEIFFPETAGEGGASAFVKAGLSFISEQAKERQAVRMLNDNRNRVIALLNEQTRKHGLKMRIADVSASVL